jgi:hypothetical protein
VNASGTRFAREESEPAPRRDRLFSTWVSKHRFLFLNPALPALSSSFSSALSPAQPRASQLTTLFSTSLRLSRPLQTPKTSPGAMFPTINALIALTAVAPTLSLAANVLYTLPNARATV